MCFPLKNLARNAASILAVFSANNSVLKISHRSTELRNTKKGNIIRLARLRGKQVTDDAWWVTLVGGTNCAPDVQLIHAHTDYV